MSRKEKLLIRLQERPKDFTYDELVTLLGGYGFVLMKTKATSGRCFRHRETGEKIKFHEPHPSSIIKMYVIDQVIEKFREIGLIQ